MSKGVGAIMSDLRTENGDPSAKATVEVGLKDWKMKKKRLELPVMWSVTPKSMIHFEDVERRHALDLSESAIKVIEGDDDLSDSWYLKNLTNSSAEIRTDLSDASLVLAILAECFCWFLYYNFLHSNLVWPSFLQ